MPADIKIIRPNWSAPNNVVAFTTTRQGGVSSSPYDQLNLGGNTQDNWDSVEQNRAILRQQCKLPGRPGWLEQIHKTDIVEMTTDYTSSQADGSFSHIANQICVVLTADCLPILLCAEDGTEVAAIHAGWRSLAGGIIEKTVTALQTPAKQLLAWLGPGICGQCYEISTEVYTTFVSQSNEAKIAFTATHNNHWLADLPILARQRLQQLGVQDITASACCTFEDIENFYSYRREAKTGRQASLIYFT